MGATTEAIVQMYAERISRSENVAEIVAEMRDWIFDCEWADSEDLDGLSLVQMLRGIERHYDGGISAFLATIPY